ncbi:MAG: hypothetical protein L6243_06050 [Candidatus Altiarchaeales archaeon]|nr:hypothetical protein [Candidatus Altiarchaeota archaeon]MBU4406191.1 hypothetical protein [Candidatus Altiarchaeota archaeon]MBU4437379.1 hypothetical protein [Candidatus Altiarchaeota archaeon]MCG2783135.1 hypothetical protein [Candidatus Altiarchaeales archaeon]
MKRYLAIVMLLLLVSGCTTGPPETSTTTTSTSTTSSTSTTTTTTSTTTTTTIKTFDTISIATWNLEGFKWSSYLIPTTKTSILTELRKYDILAAQGIPDGFEKYASLLMNDLPEYSYVTEDEYAFLYLDDITLLSHHTPNASSIRPFIAAFLIQNYTLDIAQLHTNPEKTENEINALLEVRTSNNQIWLGDLNADCYFYDRPRYSKFSWLIPDREDTLTNDSHCAYDRIIATYPVANRVLGYNISNTTLTDHYPVSIQLEIPFVNCTDIGFTFLMGNLTEPPFTADGRERSCDWELTETLVGWNNLVGDNDNIDLNKRSCTYKSSGIREGKKLSRDGWNISCEFDCCELREEYGG